MGNDVRLWCKDCNVKSEILGRAHQFFKKEAWDKPISEIEIAAFRYNWERFTASCERLIFKTGDQFGDLFDFFDYHNGHIIYAMTDYYEKKK